MKQYFKIIFQLCLSLCCLLGNNYIKAQTTILANAAQQFSVNDGQVTYYGYNCPSSSLDGGFRVDVKFNPKNNQYAIPTDASGLMPLFSIVKWQSGSTIDTLIKVGIDPNGYTIIKRIGWDGVNNKNVTYSYQSWQPIAKNFLAGSLPFWVSVRFDTVAIKTFVCSATSTGSFNSDINSGITDIKTQCDYTYNALGSANQQNVYYLADFLDGIIPSGHVTPKSPNNYIMFPRTNTANGITTNPVVGFQSAAIWDRSHPNTGAWIGQRGFDPISGSLFSGNGGTGLPDVSTISAVPPVSTSNNITLCINSSTTLSTTFPPYPPPLHFLRN